MTFNDKGRWGVGIVENKVIKNVKTKMNCCEIKLWKLSIYVTITSRDLKVLSDQLKWVIIVLKKHEIIQLHELFHEEAYVDMEIPQNNYHYLHILILTTPKIIKRYCVTNLFKSCWKNFLFGLGSLKVSLKSIFKI